MLEDASVAKLLASQDIPEAFAKVLSKSIEDEDEDLAEKVSHNRPHQCDLYVVKTHSIDIPSYSQTLRSAYTLVDQASLFVPPKLTSEAIRAGDKFGVENLGLSNEEWTTLTK